MQHVIVIPARSESLPEEFAGVSFNITYFVFRVSCGSSLIVNLLLFIMSDSYPI